MANEVFIVTKAKPFEKEEFIDVFATESAVATYIKNIESKCKKRQQSIRL
jgi:hypothetical protein